MVCAAAPCNSATAYPGPLDSVAGKHYPRHLLMLTCAARNVVLCHLCHHYNYNQILGQAKHFDVFYKRLHEIRSHHRASKQTEFATPMTVDPTEGPTVEFTDEEGYGIRKPSLRLRLAVSPSSSQSFTVSPSRRLEVSLPHSLAASPSHRLTVSPSHRLAVFISKQCVTFQSINR